MVVITKRKKLFILTLIIFVVLAVTVTFTFISLPLTILKENKCDDARKIALKQFGLDCVWVVSAGTAGSAVITQKTPHFPIYVLGEKNGEEVFIIVPQLKKYDAYQVDWVFEKSFKELVDELNIYAGYTVCQPNNYEGFAFIDYTVNFSETIGDNALDIDFMIMFKEYVIFQSGKKIIIRNVI